MTGLPSPMWSGRAIGPSGPVFGLERDSGGTHGRILKKNLNAASA